VILDAFSVPRFRTIFVGGDGQYHREGLLHHCPALPDR
jgi:hypothetical protein